MQTQKRGRERDISELALEHAAKIICELKYGLCPLRKENFSDCPSPAARTYAPGSAGWCIAERCRQTAPDRCLCRSSLLPAVCPDTIPVSRIPGNSACRNEAADFYSVLYRVELWLIKLTRCFFSFRQCIICNLLILCCYPSNFDFQLTC